MRIAAIGDIHCNPTSYDKMEPLFSQISQNADVLLLCGDLVDYGLPEEASAIARQLSSLKIPILAVLGNHEYESGKQDDIKKILADAGAMILDGDAREVSGVGFAGVKGFAGGFGERTLGPWGEEMTKRFVNEAIAEALKLETALARLRSNQRIVLLHYAPIRATVVGEPEEIYPFLGSSRLEDPLNRYPVTAVFHGHAHRGAPEGRTKNHVPVYNVAMKLLQNVFPKQPPVRIIEIADD